MAAGKQNGSSAAAPAAGELPGAPWFSLQIYRDMSNWSQLEWYLAIACRQFVHRFGHTSSTTPSHWDCIAQNPVNGNGYYIGMTDRSGPVSAIDDVDEEEIEELKERLWDPRFRLVAVDLRASDIAIKAGFERWLKEHRWKRKPVRRAMTEDDIKNWTDSCVIPYIDTQLYERAIGKRFRPSYVQKALFAERRIFIRGREPKSILEQSTQMYAKRLLSPAYLDRIAAQLGRFTSG